MSQVHVSPYGLVDASRVVVQVFGTDASDGSVCPHCGATGKYIVRFKCADGVIRGAMRGCYSKVFVKPTFLETRSHWERKLKKYPGWRKAIEAIAGCERQAQWLIEEAGKGVQRG